MVRLGSIILMNTRTTDRVPGIRKRQFLCRMAPWHAACALVMGLCAAGALPAADIQGVITDWNCVQPMVKTGRQKVLHDKPECSLGTKYSRSAYGLIAVDKKFYKLDDAGRAWALKLLKDTPDKDNLKVVVSGDVEGNTIHVKNMSEL